MELFDTHAHFEGTAAETASLLERARAAGVSRIVAVGGSESLDRGALEASRIACGGASSHPEVYLALGRDRDQIHAPSRRVDWSIADAVGETGLDYHYSPGTRKEQIALFEEQLDLAARLSLPVVVHTREADDDTLAALRAFPCRGVAHSFTGSPEFCRALLDLGFFISFSGIVTFRSADNVRETLRAVPDDRLLVETDTPFLAPVPFRGRANEPAFVAKTLEFVARERGMAPEEAARLTSANAVRLFGEHPRRREGAGPQ